MSGRAQQEVVEHGRTMLRHWAGLRKSEDRYPFNLRVYRICSNRTMVTKMSSKRIIVSMRVLSSCISFRRQLMGPWVYAALVLLSGGKESDKCERLQVVLAFYLGRLN